jgi:hypothetical protein
MPTEPRQFDPVQTLSPQLDRLLDLLSDLPANIVPLIPHVLTVPSLGPKCIGELLELADRRARERESEDEMIARVMEESLAEAQAAGAAPEPPHSISLIDHNVTRAEVRAALQCPVCLCELEFREKGVVELKCEHVFHMCCLQPWLDGHHTCPVCPMYVDEG